MFSLFKSGQGDKPKDVKGLRDTILRFIKDQLQKMEGEGDHIKGLQLFIACSGEDKHLYETALNTEQGDVFKHEVQRIADDFALGLPDNWTMDIDFTDELLPEAIKAPNLPVGLFIRTRQQFIQKSATAYIHVLSGQAEKEEYEIKSSDHKTNIGRERKVQVKDGFFRLNDIAFPGDSSNEANKYISRQHAHIEWSNDADCFMIFADEGGVPPGNKIKIRSVTDENLIKLNSTQIGHQLQEGDQVILGESAVLEFSYKQLTT